MAFNSKEASRCLSLCKYMNFKANHNWERIVTDSCGMFVSMQIYEF